MLNQLSFNCWCSLSFSLYRLCFGKACLASANRMNHARRAKAIIVALEPALILLEIKLQKNKFKVIKKTFEVVELAQYLRFSQSLILDDTARTADSWAREMLELDIRLREVVQREAFLIEQCQQVAENQQQ